MKLRIKEVRLQKRISQHDLANKIGISPSYLSEIEHGLKFPNVFMLMNIACALNICPKELIKCTVQCKNRNLGKCDY